jgi:hypothetical protein
MIGLFFSQLAVCATAAIACNFPYINSAVFKFYFLKPGSRNQYQEEIHIR